MTDVTSVALEGTMYGPLHSFHSDDDDYDDGRER